VPELVERCRRTLDRAVRDGFDVLAAAQRANLDRFWDRADVRVQPRLNPVRQQQAVRGISTRSRRRPGVPKGPESRRKD
jgi:alpha,alpha-trehalose phosphorylase